MIGLSFVDFSDASKDQEFLQDSLIPDAVGNDDTMHPLNLGGP